MHATAIICDGTGLPHTNAAALVSGYEGIHGYGSKVVYSCDAGYIGGNITYTCGGSGFKARGSCTGRVQILSLPSCDFAFCQHGVLLFELVVFCDLGFGFSFACVCLLRVIATANFL
jgi:hypothetical protein